ncbi:MAG: flagellar motor protein MotB [bacterium]
MRQKKPRQIALLWAVLTFLASGSAYAKVSYETLTFIDSDGYSYVNYATTRSDVNSYTVFLDKAENLGDYLYINPNQYQFDDSEPAFNQLKFDQGSYATISQGSFINALQPEKSAVRIERDGTYRLQTWDGSKQSNGHYGIWNTPDPFARFAAAWVFPAQFEVTGYHSNREGEWVQRGNTLAFFTNDANNLTFEFTYQRRSQPAFSALKAQLENNRAVAVEQQGDALKVTLTNEILFASGSAELSAAGRDLLRNVVSNLSSRDAYNFIVEGHTDDVPIRGQLQRLYPTNWELSAKRALNVVHALDDAGIDPGRLQARAFGAHKPRVPNDNDDNRRENRRIELLIEPVS